MEPLRIVIADDHSAFRDRLAEFLKNRKELAVVGQARDGFEAVTVTQILHPDLILMDIRMPDMSGLEAAKQIKATCPGTKVVFVTLHEEKTYRLMGEIIGVDGFVSKSAIAKDLPKVLREMKVMR